MKNKADNAPITLGEIVMIMILKKIKTKNGLKNRKRRTALTIARLYLMSQENEFYILKQLKKQKKTKAKKQTKIQPNRVISQNVCNRGKITHLLAVEKDSRYAI